MLLSCMRGSPFWDTRLAAPASARKRWQCQNWVARGRFLPENVGSASAGWQKPEIPGSARAQWRGGRFLPEIPGSAKAEWRRSRGRAPRTACTTSGRRSTFRRILREQKDARADTSPTHSLLAPSPSPPAHRASSCRLNRPRLRRPGKRHPGRHPSSACAPPHRPPKRLHPHPRSSHPAPSSARQAQHRATLDESRIH